MSRTLLLHDRFAPPGNPDAYLEVLDPHPREGLIKVFDASLRTDKYVKVSPLLDDVYTGLLAVSRKGKPRLSLAAQPDCPALMERLNFVHKTMGRIHEIEANHGLSFRQAYQIASSEYAATTTAESREFPSLASAYRYRQLERNGLPELRGDANKGNRHPRYSDEVINTIWMAAEQHYLKPHSSWSFKRLTEHVNRTLPEGCPTMSIKYVKKIVTQHVSVDPELERMLPDDAIAGKSFAKKRIRIAFPFERIEQDALHMPFLVRTPSGIASNVYLVHAIDCGTSYPVGWRLVIGQPTESDTLACIELYMSPRKAELFRELGIVHGINAYGTPGQISVDNGPENKGRRIDGLQKLGVDVHHCTSKSPQEKPYIERINRSLKDAAEGLPGCTRFDGKDGVRDPIALGDTLMTLEELERWTVRWLYEKWVHTPLERFIWDVTLDGSVKGMTPAERWKHYEDTCLAISLPPSRAEWLAALYEHTERRVSRKTGISVDGLVYKGDGIARLLSTYGEHRPVHVLFNPDDFREIYVYEGDDFPLITLTNEHVRPETKAWSFKDAKKKFADTKSMAVVAPEAERFDADMHGQAVASSLAPRKRPKRPSRAEENRETRARDKEARALELAAKHPRPVPPPKGAQHKHSDSAAAQPSPTSLGLGEAALLPVLNRKSGNQLK